MRSLFVAGLMSALLLKGESSQAAVLTPEKLITAPRPGNSIANPAGTRALVGCRTFSFEDDAFSESLYLLDLPSSSKDVKQTTPESIQLDSISDEVSSGFWLSNDISAYIDSKNNKVYAKDISTQVNDDSGDKGWIAIGDFGAPINDVKVARSNDGKAAHLIFSAQVYADGNLTAVKEHDESEAFKEWGRVKVYDSTFTRHWDKWIYPGKQIQLFAVDLKQGKKASDWSFDSPIRNLLNDTTLAIPPPPNGGQDDYFVSATHVIFTSKDPDLTPSWHTKQNIYLVPIKGGSRPIQLTEGDHGATASPILSHDGKQAAWLQMDKDGVESDQRKIYVTSISQGSIVQVFAQKWHLSPSSIAFSKDDRSLIGIVEEKEQQVLFSLDLTSKEARSDPQILSHYGGIGSLQVLDQGYIVEASSLRGPTELYLVSPHADHNAHLQTKAVQLTNFTGGKSSSLAEINLGDMPEQFDFPGHKSRKSFGWIHYPPFYDASKSYPLAVLIHGGPEGAWTNSWSSRWNPTVFAAQGFLVICLDPAGSTGFGQDYQEEILHNWGGAPFDDIIAGTRHILSRFPNIDTERVVAAGASYGGYMVNWIQGHNEDKLFKGLVCHDGVFSTTSVWYSGDELYFPELGLQILMKRCQS